MKGWLSAKFKETQTSLSLAMVKLLPVPAQCAPVHEGLRVVFVYSLLLPRVSYLL
jgi:hypothetical protein